MKKLLLISTLLLTATQTNAEPVCFADAYGVKRHSPDAWVSWTYKMEGHIGEKCYYPTTKEKRHEHSHVAQLAAQRILIPKVVDSNSTVAATPLPRPSPITQPKEELVFITPKKYLEPRKGWEDEFWAPKPNPEIERAKFDLFLKQIILGISN